MTTLSPAATPTAHVDEAAVVRRRRRLRRADLLGVAVWASAAIAVGLYFSSGLLDLGTPGAALTSLGIVAGLIASDLVLVMLVLAARIPALDRTIGHDAAMALHRRLGKPSFYLLLAHAALLTLGYAAADRVDVATETAQLLSSADMPLAYLALGGFAAVVVTSLVVVHRKLPYEAWHVIHLLSYAAVLGALPHQLSQGGVLAEGTAQRVYWIALYVVALGAIVVFRVLRPAALSLRHQITVDTVERISPDAISIHLRGRDLDRLGARGGQFFSWRFWTASTWWHAHPVSLSAAPTRHGLRITVREAGAGTRALAALKPGTPVSFSGPFGIFTAENRVHRRVAVLAAGIGVTPIVGLLHRLNAHPGDVTIVVRASRREELYLWDEIEEWAELHGMNAYVSLGARGRGAESWLAASDVKRGVSARSIFPDLARSDVYLCGPDGWADVAEAAVRGAGAAPDNIHRERFGW
jgi:predicted ferric reductase